MDEDKLSFKLSIVSRTLVSRNEVEATMNYDAANTVG